MQPKKDITFWDRMASIYDEHQYNDNYKGLIQRITDDVGTVSHVLDMATGTGIVALAIANHVDVVDAIDYSPEMIAAAQDKASKMGINNVNFSVQRADELDFHDDTFDIVVICNGLHLMELPERGLAEAKRILKPDGVLIAPTPCCGETPEASVRAQRMMEQQGFPIRYLFTAEGFRELVQSCGFTVLERDRMPYRMPLEYAMAQPANGK